MFQIVSNIDEVSTESLGTKEYMAPEVMNVVEGHDKSVDWWGLGVIL